MWIIMVVMNESFNFFLFKHNFLIQNKEKF